MTSDFMAVDRHMGAAFAKFGFVCDGVDDALVYGDRPAWAVYYHGEECRLQVCWSARDGGVDIMLGPLDAPRELGLSNPSKKWHHLLLLSDIDDGLTTPDPLAAVNTWWDWRLTLFEKHYPAARAALLLR